MTLWIIANILPNIYAKHLESSLFILNQGLIRFLLIAAAALCGFGFSLLWTVTGNYLAECASDRTKGFYFGYSLAIILMCQIFGNAFAGGL